MISLPKRRYEVSASRVPSGAKEGLGKKIEIQALFQPVIEILHDDNGQTGFKRHIGDHRGRRDGRQQITQRDSKDDKREDKR